MKLTKQAVAKLEPRASRYSVFDEAVSGFGVMVQPTGAKSYVLEYRPAGMGRTASKKRVTLGTVEALPLDAARKAAGDMLAKIRLGGDPMADRAKAKAEATVKAMVEDFLVQHVEAKRKDRTADEYRRLLEAHVVPALGVRKLKDVTRADLSRLHGKMQATPVQANRVVAIFGAMWTWASKRDIVPVERNPARGIERNREAGKERYLSDDELARLGATLRLAETDGLPWTTLASGSKHGAKPEQRRSVVSPYITGAIRLLLLSGMRLREVLGLTWASVDFQRGLLFLSDSKTGRKTVVLSGAALQLLTDLPREAGSDLVFPGEGGNVRPDITKPWYAVRTHAGLEDVRLHDLRHSNASVGAGAGVPLQVIGRILGHTQVATTNKYAHLHADPVRRAADTISSHITAAMGDGGEPAEVLPLKRRKAGA